MSLFLLTEENCLALKRAVGALLPQIQSAHLTEALAYALGFRTHAALRASVASNQQHTPSLVKLDMPRFIRRMSDLGYACDDLPDLTSLARSSAIPDRPFVQFKLGDRASNDAHYNHCRRFNRPMMMVQIARTYATLEWDCFTTTHDYDDRIHGDDNDGQLMRSMFAHFQSVAKGAPGKPIFNASAFVGSVTKLLPEMACRLAEDYFEMLYLPGLMAHAQAVHH